jgi:hypothetical protein
MSIRWDALLARHTARELDALLRGARVRALRLDGGARDLVLLFRDRALLWRLHPTRGHLRMLPPLEPAEGDLALKARVVRVQSLPDDRVLRFGFAPTGSARPPVSLVVELLGNQWNAAVVEGDSERGEPEIVRHVLWRREAGRAPRVGHPYQPPPSLGRKGVDGDMTLEEWGRLLGSLEPGQRAAALVKAVAWTSPLNARPSSSAPRMKPRPMRRSRRVTPAGAGWPPRTQRPTRSSSRRTPGGNPIRSPSPARRTVPRTACSPR